MFVRRVPTPGKLDRCEFNLLCRCRFPFCKILIDAFRFLFRDQHQHCLGELRRLLRRINFFIDHFLGEFRFARQLQLFHDLRKRSSLAANALPAIANTNVHLATRIDHLPGTKSAAEGVIFLRRRFETCQHQFDVGFGQGIRILHFLLIVLLCRFRIDTSHRQRRKEKLLLLFPTFNRKPPRDRKDFLVSSAQTFDVQPVEDIIWVGIFFFARFNNRVSKRSDFRLLFVVIFITRLIFRICCHIVFDFIIGLESSQPRVGRHSRDAVMAWRPKWRQLIAAIIALL